MKTEMPEEIQTKMLQLANLDRDKSDVMNEDWTSFHAYTRGFNACYQALATRIEELESLLRSSYGFVKQGDSVGIITKEIEEKLGIK